MFQEQVLLLSNDTSIEQYFANKNLVEFVKLYIQVDKLIGGSLNDSNTVFDKLESISSSLTNSQTYLANILQTKIDSIKDITNNLFDDIQKENSNSHGAGISNIRIVLDNFKDKLENINAQKINEFDRKTLDILSNIQSTVKQSLDSHSIVHKIAAIETNVTNINEHFSSNSSKKGQLAEGMLMSLMTNLLPDTEVFDTSHLANAGDIQLVKDSKPTILIDSKHFASKCVPKRDLDKFYTDIQQQNCSGILCNAFGGIANKQHLEIDIIDKNIIVFVHSHRFDPQIFQLAVNIIYNMHEQIKDRDCDSITIDQLLFQNLKIEYNYYIQSFRHHLDIIKTNVNSLSQLSFTLIDNFFKRKTNVIELKKFSCHICSAQLSTEKILKTHIKRQHSTNSPS